MLPILFWLFVAVPINGLNNDTTYRLQGESSEWGRVEVRVDGQWGGVCATDWDDQDAQVLCSSHHFAGGYASDTHRLPGLEEAVTEPLWASKFQCQGHEVDLNDCPHTGWEKEHPCKIQAVAICHNYVYLGHAEYGHNMQAGSVELYANRSWTCACADNFTQSEASVVCGVLNPHLPHATVLQGGALGPHNFTMISCRGNETGIAQCNVTHVETCPSGLHAVVMCTKEPYTEEQLEGYSVAVAWDGEEMTGPVIVFHHSGLYSVCADAWDDRDAKVVCREFGAFNDGIAYKHYPNYLTSEYRMWTSEYQCRGNETVLENCTHGTIVVDSQCKTGHHAGVLCFNDDGISYRLQGESSEWRRVEVRVNGQWGGVCATDWDDQDAQVLCSSHHFSGGSASESDLLPGMVEAVTGPLWAPSFQCQGHEVDLNDCPHIGWVKEPGCKRQAAALCHKNVVLMGGVQSREILTGAVAVYHDGAWKAVCDSILSVDEAKLVCLELDPTMHYAKVVKGSAFGSLDIPVGITASFCMGKESSFSSCLLEGGGRCSGGHYASVICSQDPHYEKSEYTVSVHLSGYQFTGPVELYHNGTVGAVCSDLWDDIDAKVVCKELMGYNNGQAYTHFSSYNSHEVPVWTSNYECTGSETHLADCPHTRLRDVSQCETGHHAGIICLNDEGISYRVQGESSVWGRVEVRINGQWGSVCTAGWGHKEANVLCASQNFVGGHAAKMPEMAPLSGPSWRPGFMCRGQEHDLNQCPNRRWVQETGLLCGGEAAVFCHNKVQLIGGEMTPEKWTGEVMLFHRGDWILVCDSNFTEKDAMTVCWQADPEYSHVAVLEGSLEILEHSYIAINCAGTHDSLSLCTIKNISSCPSRRTAKIVCSKTAITQAPSSKKVTTEAPSSTVGLNETRVALMGGVQGREILTGAVAVYHDGAWKAVCDSILSVDEAKLVCLELDPTMHYAKVIKGSAFGSLDIPVGITASQCMGKESSFSRCLLKGGGRCSGGHYASVICSQVPHYEKNEYTVSVHLSGYQFTGPVELYHNGTVGAVCSDLWDHTDAKVVCKELMGYNNGQAYTHFASYNSHDVPVWTSNYECTGIETHLADCPHTRLRDVGECETGHHAGIICLNDEGISYRVQGESSVWGRVEVRINGQWGSVCAAGWGHNEANVLCTSQNFAGGHATKMPEMAPLSGPSWRPGFMCRGQEHDLNQCPNRRWVQETGLLCGGEAAVFCHNKVQLIGGEMTPEKWTGEVMLFHRGDWILVCDSNFTAKEAMTVCWQADPEYTHVAVLEGSLEIFEHSYITINCPGTEDSIGHCTIKDIGSCPSRRTAKIVCSKTAITQAPNSTETRGVESTTAITVFMSTESVTEEQSEKNMSAAGGLKTRDSGPSETGVWIGVGIGLPIFVVFLIGVVVLIRKGVLSRLLQKRWFGRERFDDQIELGPKL